MIFIRVNYTSRTLLSKHHELHHITNWPTLAAYLCLSSHHLYARINRIHVEFKNFIIYTSRTPSCYRPAYYRYYIPNLPACLVSPSIYHKLFHLQITNTLMVVVPGGFLLPSLPPSLPPSLSFSLCSLSLSHPHTLSLSTLYLSMYTMGNLAKQLKHTESEAAHTCKLSFSHTHAHTHAHTLAHSHTHTRMCVYAYTYTYLQISRVYT